MVGDIETPKQQLHHLIDQLPTEQVAVLLSLLNAPPDDEPYTAEQRERDALAEASIAADNGVSHDELLREFGI